jgi:ketosteroid isomerase-like protein
VFQLANQEAHRLRHDSVGTEHLLLALMKDGDGLAFRVLKQFGCDLPLLRQAVEKTCGDETETGATGPLPRRGDVQRAVELAWEKARELNHDQVGTGHLLLALLLLPNTKCLPVLTEVVSDPEQVRVQVLTALAAPDWAVQDFHAGRARASLDWLFAFGMGAVPQSKDIAGIQGLQAKWLVAERTSNWDALLALCTEDVVWAPPEHPVLQGRAAVAAWGLAQPRVPVELSEILTEIALCGATAYTRGVYHLKCSESNQNDPHDVRGRFVRVLRKQEDGTWLVAFDTWCSS